MSPITILAMGTRETRTEHGRRRGRAILLRLVDELRHARHQAGLSQRDVARLLGWSQPDVSRLERLSSPRRTRVEDLSAFAAIVGMELSASLHPMGDPLRDKGHQALIGRFRAILSAAWQVAAEVPLPNIGDPRSWDLVLRLATTVVGVEAETRLRDMQAFVRRIRLRERDGGVEHILIVLAESRANRLLLPQLLEALGPAYQTLPRVTLRALREGLPLNGSGVLLV